MLKKLTALIFAAAFVAACESAPEETQTADTSGQVKPVMTQQPAAAPAKPGIKAGSNTEFVLKVGDRVFFELDKYELTADSQGALKAQAAWLAKYSNVTVLIQGHCDERGTREYNIALGERRANAVKDYLSALGIARTRMTTISYGKERPVAIGHDEEAWAQNRRSVTVLESQGS